MSNDSGGDGDKVGYKRPPQAHRFSKGVSGNPRGRPRKPKAVNTRAQDMDSIILSEAYREISLREGNRVIKMPAIAAATRNLSLKALKGDRAALVSFMTFVQQAQKRVADQVCEFMITVLQRKADWEDSCEIWDARGEERPNPLPHPDDFHVDHTTGAVYLVGPFNMKEKQHWDRVMEDKRAALESIKRLKVDLKEDPENADYYMDALTEARDWVALYDLAAPDEEVRRSPAFDAAGYQPRLQEAMDQRRKARG